MNALQIFNYQEKQVRTILQDGEPWFVAKDVCDVLEITNHRDATDRLNNVMKGVATTDTPGGKQEMLIVSEAGVYKLVFTSRKPEAEKFTDWLAAEVIPQIRRTGSYSVQPLSPTEALLQSVQLLAEQEKRLARVEDKLTTVNHRINSLDAINIEGDARQRLVKMVQKYAHGRGLAYNKGWHDFKAAFNLAYSTNLELLITNFRERTGIKNVSTPGYLAAVNRLGDGIRVADKMINK